jgi:hypothetical protein
MSFNQKGGSKKFWIKIYRMRSKALNSSYGSLRLLESMQRPTILRMERRQQLRSEN